MTLLAMSGNGLELPCTHSKDFNAIHLTTTSPSRLLMIDIICSKVGLGLLAEMRQQSTRDMLSDATSSSTLGSG
jgi:hypothetical protein